MHSLVDLLLCINQHTKFKVRSFADSNDMIGAKLKNGSCDSDHAHYNNNNPICKAPECQKTSVALKYH